MKTEIDGSFLPGSERDERKLAVPPLIFDHNWVQRLLVSAKIVSHPAIVEFSPRGRDVGRHFASNFGADCIRLAAVLALFVHGIPLALAMIQAVAFPRPKLLIPYVKDWVEYAFSFAVLVLALSSRRFSDIQNKFVAGLVEEKIVNQSRRSELADRIVASNRNRQSFWVQFGLFVLAEVLAGKLLWDLLSDGSFSWHGLMEPGSSWLQSSLGLRETPTWCALYVCLVVWPTCNYLIFNWIINGISWVIFTRWLTRDLHIDAMHPDQCGGLHYMKYSVLAWCALIVTVGILISLNTLTYLPLPGATTRWDIILEVSCFVIGALVIFLAPMCWLTWQLLDAKMAAERDLDGIGRDLSRVVRAELKLKEIEKLSRGNTGECKSYIEAHAYMVLLSQNVSAMKIWPLDIKSVGEIVASVCGPLATMLIPDLYHRVLNAITGL